MKAEKKAKLIKFLYNILFFAFIFSAGISITVSLVEAFSYSGSFLKHTGFSPLLFNYALFLSGICVAGLSGLVSLRTGSKKLIKGLLSLTMMSYVIFLSLTLLVNILETINYTNYVYSHVHIQPKLLIDTVKIGLFFILILIFANPRRHISIFFPKFGKFFNFIPRINLSKINIKKYDFRFAIRLPIIKLSQIGFLVLLGYSLYFLFLLFLHSVNFIDYFYKVDKSYKQENELKYFLGNMSIYEWVNEYLPESKEMIFWCDKQNITTDMITFDPQVIWMTYEGLSRVFLTNCRYANIPSIGEYKDYFDDEKLLLVSISKCDPHLEDTRPDFKKEMIKYFNILNNSYICKSREIVPNLYLYTNKD